MALQNPQRDEGNLVTHNWITRSFLLMLLAHVLTLKAAGQTNAPPKLLFSVEVQPRHAVPALDTSQTSPATNRPPALTRQMILSRREEERIKEIADTMWKSGGPHAPNLLEALLKPTPRNLYSLIDPFAPVAERGPGGKSILWSWDARAGQWPPVTPVFHDPSKNMAVFTSFGR